MQAASLLSKILIDQRRKWFAAMDGNLAAAWTISRSRRKRRVAAADIRTAANAGDGRPT